MSLERTIYVTSYIQNYKVVSGSFPVVVEGAINCYTKPFMSYEEKRHILSEEPDADYYSKGYFLNSLAGDNLSLLSNSEDSILYF